MPTPTTNLPRSINFGIGRNAVPWVIATAAVSALAVEPLLELQNAGEPLGISQDDSRLFTADGSHFYTWDRTSGELLHSLQIPEKRQDATVSHDGRLLALLEHQSDEVLITVLDTQTGEAVSTLPHDGWITAGALEFSPDDSLLCSVGSNDQVTSARVWRTLSGEVLGEVVREGYSPDEPEWHFRRAINAAVFSPEGNRVVLCGNHVVDGVGFGFIAIWDYSTGPDAIAVIDTEELLDTVAWSGSGEMIAAAGYEYNDFSGARRIHLLNAKSLEKTQTLEVGSAGQSEMGFLMVGSGQIRFSPNGRYLLEGTGGIWDIGVGRRVGVLPVKWGVYRTRNDEFMMSGLPRGWVGSGHVALWAFNDLLSNLVEPLEGNSKPIGDDSTTSSSISPDLETVASASSNGLRLIDIGTGAVVREQAWTEADFLPGQMTFSPDGSQLIVLDSGSTRTLYQFRIPDLELKDSYHYTFPTYYGTCVFSFDGTKILLWGSEDVVVLDPAGLIELRKYRRSLDGPIAFANVFPDSERLFVGLEDPTFGGGSGERVYSILDADSAETIGLIPAYAFVRAWTPVAGTEVILSPSGFTGAEVTAFSYSGEVIKEFRAVAFGRGAVPSDDGRFLVGISDAYVVTLWDFESGRLLGFLENGTIPLSPWSSRVRVSSDHRRLAVTDNYNVSVWDISDLTTELRIGPAMIETDGSIRVPVNGRCGQRVRLQRSENLVDWQDWQTMTLGGDGCGLIDTTTATPTRFYRAVNDITPAAH